MCVYVYILYIYILKKKNTFEYFGWLPSKGTPILYLLADCSVWVEALREVRARYCFDFSRLLKQILDRQRV